MTEPLHLHPVSPVIPSLSLASRRKDLVPMIVDIFILKLAVYALQKFGHEIRVQAVISRKVARRAEIYQMDLKTTGCRQKMKMRYFGSISSTFPILSRPT